MTDTECTALAGASRALQVSSQRVGSSAEIDRLCSSEGGLVEVEAFIARLARLTDLVARLAPPDVDRGLIDPARELHDEAMRGHDAQGWGQIAQSVFGAVARIAARDGNPFEGACQLNGAAP